MLKSTKVVFNIYADKNTKYKNVKKYYSLRTAFRLMFHFTAKKNHF